MVTVPIENSGQVGLIVASCISIFIVAVSVALRLVAKSISSGIDYSEYCILAALFFNTALHTCCLLLVTHGGFGLHVVDIFARFGPETVTFFFKGIMAFALLWNATICFSKLSVLLMYTALIPVPAMVKWARAIAALIIAWCLADVMAGFLICRPLARNWDMTIPGKCGSQPKFYFAMGLINIITDIVLIILPMPFLYNLRMATKKKLLAASLLSIGIMTWIITIYRQVVLPSLNFADMTHEGVLATLLSGLEPSIAIVLACLPLLRPLLGRSNKNKPSSYGYGSEGGSGLYSKKPHRSGPFVELDEETSDNDNSSEVRLQPLKGGEPVGNNRHEMDTSTIAVERRWEVTHEVKDPADLRLSNV
ncbi:uncharacterized protein EI97DRAFT_494860 [Westerdykella ornata]|uniref:Rhodopsin domain-containing protein n=1 Tax=Westerdykella ornata TaxID=318751 RepID=A0A6A6JG72_WESOR|nr:uncharacterized protein EI97DRAFT_494860 [Westerdykella ornata]KAF2275265.1 hypothetical protein EI97DRAFT_494860 [Westerdykella ornata]